MKVKNNNSGLTKGVILGILLTIITYQLFNFLIINSLSAQEVEKKVFETIKRDTQGMYSDDQISVKHKGEEYGMYTFDVSVATFDYVSFATKDGKKLFITFLDMDKKDSSAVKKTDPKPTEIIKTEKPKVELFVMSHCPYGTQIEKGIIPAIEALGDKVDFELKFCDYAMRDKVEIDEQIAQYCIQKEQNDKLFPYLKCFLSKGEGSECLSIAKVDTKMLSSCILNTDKEFSISENYKNKVDYEGNFPGFGIHKADNEKYDVKGSPTLIINGVDAGSIGRDSSSLLKAICSGFNEMPSECNIELSNETPQAGF